MKNKNKSHWAVMVLASLLAASCSSVDDDERLIYVKPADVARKVLIEDFTGQRCVNCPNATDEIARLQEAYGEDNVIAVGIHSGPLGYYTRGNVLGLSTQTGEEYYNYWKVEYQPAGVINRKGGVQNYTAWQGTVQTDIQQTARLAMALDATVEDGQIRITVKTQGINGIVTGKLQLWVVEDGITALQMMPDGSANANYVHSHVFRAAVNGTWGTDITLCEGEEQEHSFSIALSDEWKTENLSIVAFVYNDSGVEQVERTVVGG